MRQLLSTALVACIVGALAGASFGAVAQAPAEPIAPAAINADTVDGLSAVKATSKKARRKGKLVATDAKGFLPANILKAKWGLISGKPAFLADGQVGWSEVQGIPGALADGQIGWGEVQGIPAGFADGVDNIGSVGYTSYMMPTTYSVSTNEMIYVIHPPGVDTELMIIPATSPDEISISRESFARVSASELGHFYLVNRVCCSDPIEFKVRVRVFNSGIAPAGIRPAVLRKAVRSKIEVGVVKGAEAKKRAK